MKSFLRILLITISVYEVLAVPKGNDCRVHSDTKIFGEDGNLFEGDMMLNTEQMEAILNGTHRNGIIGKKYRWRNKILFYEIDTVFDDKRIRAIKHALKILKKHTCLNFEKKNENTSDYVYVTGEPTGCHSWVGRQGGKQILNLKPKGCFRIGTIIHEFIHALGFYHQQSASNRDEYVQIFYENISPKSKHNFDKHENNVITDYGIPYDYDSLMHYPSCAFSKNGSKTIVPWNTHIEIGQRTHLSVGDILKINKMYKCTI